MTFADQEQAERGASAVEQSIAQHNTRAEKARAYRKHARAFAADHQGAYLAEVVMGLLAQIENYEDGIAWQTTCTHCASLWNDNYAQYEQIAQLRADLERVTAELAETRADVQRGIEWQRGYADRLVESQTLLQQVAAERDAMRERVSLLANAAQAFRNGRYEMGEAWLARVESLNATRKAAADAAEEGK